MATAGHAFFEAQYAHVPDAPGWNEPCIDLEVLAHVRALLAEARVVAPARLLEIGCGMGNLSIALAHDGHEVCGIDVAPTAIERARRRIPTLLRDRLRFDLGDATQALVGAASERFDAVIDGLCLHCVIGLERRRLLGHVHDALQPGAPFIVVTMCAEPRAAALRERFDAASRCIVSHGLAQRYLGRPAELCAELRAARFEVEHARVIAGNDHSGDQDLLLAVARRRA